MQKDSNHHDCTKIHKVLCSILNEQYSPDSGQIIIKLKTNTYFVMELWHICLTLHDYNSIHQRLQQTKYWKMYYSCNSRQINTMEPQSESCLIQ